MKKNVFCLFLGVVLSIFLFASCEKEDEEGKIWYECGASSVSLQGQDYAKFSLIENAYKERISALSGVSVEGNMFIMNGNYEKCDQKVINACKLAEDDVYNVELEGYILWNVKADYENGDSKVVYEHTFGNK